MTGVVLAPRHGPADGLEDEARALRHWLVDHALPLWWQRGVDRRGGGFFEKLELDAQPREEPRRTRVVARQIYVFATAARHRWIDRADEVVEHGLQFLMQRLRQPDGLFAASVRCDGTVVRGDFDLYEHAFVLFALAAACRDRPDRARLAVTARELLRQIRDGWGHASGGFDEARPRTLPLKSNPHMHLLEAALEWIDILPGPQRREWEVLADELVGLALHQFIDAGTGAVREYFDGAWAPYPEPARAVIEPGHQFEWSWLLRRWACDRQHLGARRAADRLLDLGERHGVDGTRNVAMNELRADLSVADAGARLWPQTERLKAWWLAACLGEHDEAVAAARDRAALAARGLGAFFLAQPPGLWHEQMHGDGSFVSEACRASSLYHIVCSIESLRPPGLVQPSGPAP